MSIVTLDDHVAGVLAVVLGDPRHPPGPDPGQPGDHQGLGHQLRNQLRRPGPEQVSLSIFGQ